MYVNSNALFNVLMVFNVLVFVAAFAFVYVVLCLLARFLPAPAGVKRRLSRGFYVAVGFLSLLGAGLALALLA